MLQCCWCSRVHYSASVTCLWYKIVALYGFLKCPFDTNLVRFVWSERAFLFKLWTYFKILLSSVEVLNYRPPAPFLYEGVTHVNETVASAIINGIVNPLSCETPVGVGLWAHLPLASPTVNFPSPPPPPLSQTPDESSTHSPVAIAPPVHISLRRSTASLWYYATVCPGDACSYRRTKSIGNRIPVQPARRSRPV